MTSAGVTQRHGAEDGDQVIARWAEQGQLYVATDAAGTVVACFALAGIDPDFWTPAEAVLVAEHAELQQRLADRSASDGQPSVHDAPAQAGGLGPLRRAIREIAHTRDDLATARDLAADDDTFAVEADVLERRLPQAGGTSCSNCRPLPTIMARARIARSGLRPVSWSCDSNSTTQRVRKPGTPHWNTRPMPCVTVRAPTTNRVSAAGAVSIASARVPNVR